MIAALAGLICVAASGVILITLHFLPTGLNPIRYAVSDYGWTSYHLGYRTMVVLQGVGAILIAVGLGQETDVTSLGWLFFELVGDYVSENGHAGAFPRFAARVEDLLREDVDVYVTQVVREKDNQAKS